MIKPSKTRKPGGPSKTRKPGGPSKTRKPGGPSKTRKPGGPSRPSRPSRPSKPTRTKPTITKPTATKPTAVELNGKQRRQLRALGHALDPIVQIGKDGLTDGVTKALDVALTSHELVKVKLGPSAPDDRHAAAASLAKKTKSELVQVLGKVILLYRRHPEEPKIAL